MKTWRWISVERESWFDLNNKQSEHDNKLVIRAISELKKLPRAIQPKQYLHYLIYTYNQFIIINTKNSWYLLHNTPRNKTF